jgi:hypothetical protein
MRKTNYGSGGVEMREQGDIKTIGQVQRLKAYQVGPPYMRASALGGGRTRRGYR